MWFAEHLWALCHRAEAHVSCSLQKSFRDIPIAKSNLELRDPLEPDTEVPSLSHHIRSPRGLAGSDKSQLIGKHRSQPSHWRAISSLHSCKNEMQREETKAIKLLGPWRGPSWGGIRSAKSRRENQHALRATGAFCQKAPVWSCLGMKIQAQVGSPSVWLPGLSSPACSPLPACLQRQQDVGEQAECILPFPRTALSSLEERERLLTGSCCTQQAAGPLLAARWGQTDR